MIVFASQREDFTCLRCGKCCKAADSKNAWPGGDLTWEQKQVLLTKRKKYPAAEEGCEMQYFKKGVAICLVCEIYGKQKCNRSCIDYPGQEICMNVEK